MEDRVGLSLGVGPLEHEFEEAISGSHFKKPRCFLETLLNSLFIFL